jgi:hypothetical protein
METKTSLNHETPPAAKPLLAADAGSQELYYIQNGYVGNAILWWGIDSKGYTTDITKAGKYTKEEAQKIIQRPQDIAWLCKHIDNNNEARKIIVDMQYLNKRYRLIGKRR